MHELALGWRSRVRIGLGGLTTFLAGVLAATSGAPWPLRVVSAVAFVVGASVCLDAIVFASSWRFTPAALKMPTLLSTKREVSGRDDLTVELRDGPWSQVAITGPNGTREVRVNPLISGRDLRRWWDATP